MSPTPSWLAGLTDPSQFNLKPTAPGSVLDLGCGNRKFPGAVGVDISAETEADVVHDLDSYPWPLPDATFDQVLAQDVIEHVAEPYRFMGELARVCRTGAIVQLRTPHFSSALAYGDPTHRHYLSMLGVRSLAEPGFGHYAETAIEAVSVKVDSWAPNRLAGIQAAANRWPDLYETYFAFIFTSMNIQAVFRRL